ncbi:MAG: ATP-binding protein [Syntrophomonas sp.]
MLRSSLTSRITIIIILVAVLATSVSGMMTLYISKKQFASYINSNNQALIQEYSKQITAYYDENGSLQGIQELMPNMPGMGMGRGMGYGKRNNKLYMGLQGRRILLTNQSGTIVADSYTLNLGEKLTGQENGLKSVPLVSQNGEKIGTLFISSPLQTGVNSLENAFLSSISRQIFWSIMAVTLLALLVGWLLARRISDPLAELSSGIHDLARGNLGVRVEPKGDKELYSLGCDFNLMADKLSQNEVNRTNMMASIAHELRTPLSILRGQLEAIQSGRLQPGEEISSSLVDEVIRLSRLVKDLENLGLAEAGALELNWHLSSPAELLDLIAPLRLAMEADGINFEIDIDPQIDYIKADSQRLTQILINLLSNAMRHVERGGKVGLKLRKSGSGILFAVKDNGPGIAPEDREKVFERFYRVDASRSRQAGGTGLGLAIARGYVEAHNGKIWVESEPGEGSEFFFNLPQDRDLGQTKQLLPEWQ